MYYFFIVKYHIGIYNITYHTNRIGNINMFMYHVLEMWKGIMMKESQYEELLNIKTDGEELWSEKIKHNHPYQATSYDALEKCVNLLPA